MRGIKQIVEIAFDYGTGNSQNRRRARVDPFISDRPDTFRGWFRAPVIRECRYIDFLNQCFVDLHL